MPIWKTIPVSEAPSLVLSSWRIVEVTDGSHHFVGWNVTHREGRVSQDILEFDPAQRCGVTGSGRSYQLAGPPGSDRDGEYVLQRWLEINKEAEVRDVSEEYWTKIQSSEAAATTPSI